MPQSAIKRSHLTSVIGAIVIAMAFSSAQAQTPPAPAPGSWTVETQPAASPKRPPEANPAGALVGLTAFLTDDSQPIDQGVVWHVFRDRPSADGKPPLVQTLRDSVTRTRLEPGAYLITATFGRAHLTRRLTVEANKPLQERFVLNAGGLKINTIVTAPDPSAERALSYDIYLEERDQAGNRVKIVSAAKPGRIVRLNSGLYQIVSQYGDANARVRATIAVEPGKLTEATLTHAAAKISFRLVTREGGDALTDVAWSIVGSSGDVVKETAGAVPTHILAAGTYAVVAKHQSRSFRAEFAVKSGETNVVEVVAR